MGKKRHFPNPRPLLAPRSGFLLLLLLAAGLAQACQPLNQPTPHPTHSPAPSASLAPPASPTPKPSLAPLVEPIETPVCAETSGRLETGVIETELLDKPMRYTVYLPPCYDFGENFPALYLLHGQNYAEDQWIRIGAVETADRLIRSGESPPFLIIFPYDYSFKQPTQYNFAQVFLEMLLPRIETDYRARPEAAFRAIGGLSRGGAWAIHLGARNPEIFGAMGAHSPAVFFSDMTTLRLRLSEANRETFPRVYIDVGLQDSEYNSARSFARLLNEMNIPHQWHEYLGFHEEKYWSAHVEEYLRWYAEGW